MSIPSMSETLGCTRLSSLVTLNTVARQLQLLPGLQLQSSSRIPKSVFAQPGQNLRTTSTIQLNIGPGHFQLSMLKRGSLFPPPPTKPSLLLPGKVSTIHSVFILNSSSLVAPKFNHRIRSSPLSPYPSHHPTSRQKA